VPTVADVLRRHGTEYLERFGEAIPPEHRKVLDAVTACRTGELGTVVYACSSCGLKHGISRSCGNRHCPTCQHDKTQAWLDKHTARLLPCPYFLLTFTVPAELRRFVRSHQRVCYAALFEASSGAIKRLAEDPKYIGTSIPGFFGVLHTWGRTMEYHPHVHYVAPGGGVSDDRSQWLPSRSNYFLPEKALSKIYRAKFRDAMQRAGLLDQIDPAVWHKDWVVDVKPAGDGRTSLRYLASYVFRVAISDHRILSCDDGLVTFSYRRSGCTRRRTMTLDALEFIRRFLQHVLPSGFQKVRHYGFATPNSKISFEAVRWLVTLHTGLDFQLSARPKAPPNPAPPLYCPECETPMCRVGFIRPGLSISFDTS
jgi:hypothetical protein